MGIPRAYWAPKLSTALSHIGEAGPVWLQSALVGSPSPAPSVPSRRTPRFGCRCQLPAIYTGAKPRLGAIVQNAELDAALLF